MSKKTSDDFEFTQTEVSSHARYTFGEPLKQARTKTNLTLERVATDLNVRIDYLRAIENNNPQALPEPVFTMGFIRSYAKYMNMDPQALVDLYKREVLGYANEWANIATPTTVPSAPRNWIITGAAGIVVAAYGVWFMIHRSPEPAVREQALAPATIATPPVQEKKRKKKKATVEAPTDEANKTSATASIPDEPAAAQPALVKAEKPTNDKVESVPAKAATTTSVSTDATKKTAPVKASAQKVANGDNTIAIPAPAE